jgi:hypothetical protein
MAKFTVRVQLNGEPDQTDYERLHAAMRGNGFSQTIIGGDGVEFYLPHAEYDYESAGSAEQVRELVRTIAKGVWDSSYVLVTQALIRSWYLKKVEDN